jgi:hypothetical protein
MVFPLRISIRIETPWKLAEAKVWSFVVDLRTKFLCFGIVGRLSRAGEESQYNAVLSQGIFYLRLRGVSADGLSDQAVNAIPERAPFPSVAR